MTTGKKFAKVTDIQKPKSEGVVWEDLPPDGRRSFCYPPLLSELRTRPGVWARIRVAKSRASASSMAQSARLTYPKRYEFIQRGCRLYARYIGEAQDNE